MVFFYGWVVLALCTLAKSMKAVGQNNVLGFVVPAVLRDLNISRTTLSTAFSVATIVASTANPFIGHLVDKFGARVCLPVALLLFAASLALFGFATSPWVLFVAFLGIRGCAIGALELWPNTCLNQWFVARRGRAMSVLLIATSGGFALCSVLYSYSNEHTGWRHTQFICAATSAALAVPVAALLYSNPEAIGLFPDGATPDAAEAISPLRDADHSETKPASRSPVFNPADFTFSEAIRWPLLWVFCVIWFLAAVLMAAVDFYIVEIVHEAGGDFPIAVFISIPFSISCAVGSAATGVVLEKRLVSDRVPLAISVVLQPTVMAILVTFANSPLMGIAYGVTRGLGAGLWLTTYSVFLANIFGRSHLGSIIGLAVAFAQAGTGVGPLCFGIVRDIAGSYRGILYVLALVPVPVLVAFMTLSKPRKFVAEAEELQTVELHPTTEFVIEDDAPNAQEDPETEKLISPTEPTSAKHVELDETGVQPAS